MKKSYAVVGLGRFGSSVAKELMNSGVQVLAVDINPEAVRKIAPFVTCAVNIDACDSEAFKEAGVDSVDALVVAMGNNLEASVLTIINAKELGVPYVLAKSNSEETSKVFMKVGADKVVFPEKDAGISVARKIQCNDFLGYFEIDENLNVVELQTRSQWINKSIKALNLRASHGINIIAIKREDKVINEVKPDYVLDDKCRLIVTVSNDGLKRLIK